MKTKFAATLTALATLVGVVVGIVVGVIFYRAAVSPLIAAATSKASSDNMTALAQFLSTFGGLLVSLSGALIQLIFIFIMNKIYEKIAVFLTAWELHRTQTEHEDSFTIKMYLFQFVNFYSSLFYIAFFKGRILVHFPGRDYGNWRGLEQVGYSIATNKSLRYLRLLFHIPVCCIRMLARTDHTADNNIRAEADSQQLHRVGNSVN